MDPPAIVESAGSAAYFADGRVFYDLGTTVEIVFWAWRHQEAIEVLRVRVPREALMVSPDWMPSISCTKCARAPLKELRAHS